MNIYDFKVKDNEGQEVSLSDYKGKTIMVINSATECGFTPQYEYLQDMYDKYNEQGFEILDFPCNQFGNQAPGDNKEIAQFCSSRFSITFPIFDKVEVNGENAEPLFTYLKNDKGFAGFDKEHPLSSALMGIIGAVSKNSKEYNDIKWNFTKFLIDKDGKVVERFEPTYDMKKVEEKLKAIL